MATYVNDLRLKEIATGDESGTWGTSTNTNLELIAEAFSYGTEASFSSDADATTTIADGATDPARSLYFKVTSGVSLTATRTLTIAPNTVSKVWIIENATSGSQSINISQGSGANVTIPNGDVKVVYSDGAGSGAAVVDAFANLKVTDAAQTNITSVGTLSSLTVSGDLTVDTSTLKVDSTNNRVGIGTASPSATLDIESSLPIIHLEDNVGSTARIYNDNGVLGFDADHNQGVVGSAMTFSVDASEAMRIDSSGNVGIGTTSPQTDLNIVNSSGATLDINTNLVGADSKILLHEGSSSSPANGASIRYDGANNLFKIGVGSSVDTTRLAIERDSGNVGIGTTSPSTILEIASGNSGGDAALDAPVFRINNTTESSDWDIGDVVGAIEYYSSDESGNAPYVTSFIKSVNETGNGTLPDGALTFGTATYNASGGASERMRIRSDGGVGIGQAGYASTILSLHNGTGRSTLIYGESGDANCDISLRDNSSTQGINFGAVGNNHVFKKDSTEHMRIDSSGNLLVGTTSTTPADGVSPVVLIGSSSDSSSGIGLSNSSHNWLLYNDSDGDFNIYDSDNNADRLSIDSKGTLFTGASYAHNTYAHAAVFNRNATPLGTVVIEDSDVSSSAGNTVLNLFLRDQDPAGTAVFIDFRDGGGRVGSVTHNDDGGGVSYNTTSDYRLKENVNYDWDALTLLGQLRPAKFNFISNPAKTIQGFLAHEVMDVVPSSVRGERDQMMDIGTITDSNGDIVYEGVYEHFCKTDEGQTWTRTGEEPLYQQLDYSRIVPLLTKAIQEQQTIIDDLKSRIETLEG